MRCNQSLVGSYLGDAQCPIFAVVTDVGNAIKLCDT
jgi:hypothetical protein